MTKCLPKFFYLLLPLFLGFLLVLPSHSYALTSVCLFGDSDGDSEGTYLPAGDYVGFASWYYGAYYLYVRNDTGLAVVSTVSPPADDPARVAYKVSPVGYDTYPVGGVWVNDGHAISFTTTDCPAPPYNPPDNFVGGQLGSEFVYFMGGIIKIVVQVVLLSMILIPVISLVLGLTKIL